MNSTKETRVEDLHEMLSTLGSIKGPSYVSAILVLLNTHTIIELALSKEDSTAVIEAVKAALIFNLDAVITLAYDADRNQGNVVDFTKEFMSNLEALTKKKEG